jgi:spore coat polysaccharide biosynthesis protein SpsF
MKIVSTIEARMTSSRLPEKVMMEAAGKPMLGHLIERLKLVNSIDHIVIATTTNASDDCIEEFASNMDVGIFRGDEDDVMNRVIGAGQSADADVIVEITGDCPIIDPEIIEQTIQVYKHNSVDYVSNNNVRSYPDGMDVQVFALDLLEKSAKMTDDLLDHEHVTLHIRNNPEIFSRINLFSTPELYQPDLGLTLDEKEDYILLKKIIEHFYDTGNPFFSCLDVIRFLKNNQELVDINSHVTRKGDT